MINAGIFNGDKILVQKQSDAQNGDIVVALVDDSATVKNLFTKKTVTFACSRKMIRWIRSL